MRAQSTFTRPSHPAARGFRVSAMRVLAAMLISAGVVSTAAGQSVIVPQFPKAGIEFGGYMAGEEFTRGLSNRQVFPTGGMFFEMPVWNNLGFNITGLAGVSRNVVANVDDLKGGKESFDRYSYTTTYAGALIGPAWWFPNLIGDLSATAYLRAGMVSKKTLTYRDGQFFNDRWEPFFVYGFGAVLEYPLTDNLDLRLGAVGHLTNTDLLDGYALGKSNDGFSTMTLGVSWRFLDREQRVIRPDDYFSSAINPADLPPIRGVLMNSSIQLRQFESFKQLRMDPAIILLYLGRQGAGKLPARVEFEVLHGGKRIAWSSRVVSLMNRFEVLHARQFIDFDQLAIAEGYDEQLPSGKYVVQVTVLPAQQGLTFAAHGSFQTVNLDEFFGEDRGVVADMVDRNLATISTTDENKLVIHVFEPELASGVAPGSNESALTEEEWEGRVVNGDTDARPETIARRERLREAQRLTQDADGQRKTAIIEQKSQRAFTNAVSLIRTVKSRGKASAVVAVVYFPMNGTVLSEEGRITLDNVARQFRSHPNLRVELRGYSVDYADDVYNARLSEQRTLRVYDYLARRIVPTSLIRNIETGEAPADVAGSDRAPLYRKVEIALVEDEEASSPLPAPMYGGADMDR